MIGSSRGLFQDSGFNRRTGNNRKSAYKYEAGVVTATYWSPDVQIAQVTGSSFDTFFPELYFIA